VVNLVIPVSLLTPLLIQRKELTRGLGANKGCPRFNQSSIQPSPSANAQTPGMSTPGGYGMGYMGDGGGMDAQTPTGGGSTSLKIRIGMGNK